MISNVKIAGSNNDDTIVALSGCTNLRGGEGSDIIVSYANGITIYTDLSGGKNTISTTCDTVDARGKNNSIYAQSMNNIISSSDTQSNDSYYAYIDQKTEM